MSSVMNHWFHRRAKQSIARRKRGARSTFFSRLRFEPLEERLALANLTITSVAFVDASNNPLVSITAGEGVYIQANYTSSNLPSNASYRIAYDLNGLTAYTTLTLGAGFTSGIWGWDLGAFIASPGTNYVTVTLDPDQSVVETTYSDNAMSTTFAASSPQTSWLSYTVSQIRAAYGIDSIPQFNGQIGDGTGQTIGIVDIYNDPTALTDLDGFDQAMQISTSSTTTLYQKYGAASGFLTVYNQNGVNITSSIANSGVGNVPPVDPTGDWEGEETLDVDWAHAIAPGAKIDLIETDPNSAYGGLYTGAATAAGLPGVSVVSMSWIYNFGSLPGFDSSTFVTPAGHNGVTFLASAGDGGEEPGAYPADSPNVIAVGGTSLYLDGNNYSSETGWNFPTPRTLNNGSGSYSQTGTWSSNGGGFSGTYSTAAGGTSSTATWTTTLTSNDEGWVNGTEVAATWVASPGNATNATYSIYDGSSNGTLLGTVTVDQTKAPVGIPDGSTQFAELGDYFPSSGTLTVVLRANTANGTVVADAVGIAKGWSTGGGQSPYETEPAYQYPYQTSGYRTSPDVAFDGASNTGVWIYENGGWGAGAYGTSLSAPCFAGLVAIANQERAAVSAVTLNSHTNPTQTLSALYSLPSTDFHDVTTGYNGLSAGVGYDELTGRGTPIANALVPDLAAFGLANQLVVTGEPPANATAGVPFNVTIQAEDQFGGLDTSVNGSVSVGSSSGTFVNGVATVPVTLDQVATGEKLSVSGDGLNTQTTSFNVVPGPASQIVFMKEPPSILVGAASFGFTVVVEDAFGNLETNYSGSLSVNISSGPGGGVLAGTTNVSVSGGAAVYSGLELNGLGDYVLSVSGGILPTVYTSVIDDVSGLPTKLAMRDDPPPTVIAGSLFTATITVEDGAGDLSAGFSGNVTVSLANPNSGTLGGTLTVAAVNGVAAFDDLVLDTAATGEVLKFTSAGLSSTTSSAFNILAGAATRLAFVSQPTNVTSDALFGLSVVAEDAFGNLASYSGDVSVALSTNPGGSQLNGSLTATAHNGLAAFSHLSLTKADAGYVISASSASLTAATSTFIRVDAGAATQLVITTDPSPTVSAGSPFALTVTAEDAEGNVATSFADPVTVVLAADSTPGALGGTTTVTASGGVAAFNGLALGKAAVGYRLVATSDWFQSADSTAFSVLPGVATQLVIMPGSADRSSVGSPFAVTVAAEDTQGNIATSFAGSIGMALETNPGSGVLGGTTSLSAASGLAVFSDLSIDTVGAGYVLEADGGGLTPALTQAIDVSPGTLTISAAAGDQVAITFQDSTDFTVAVNGGSPLSYAIGAFSQVVYQGPTTGNTSLSFSDLLPDDQYVATQSIGATTLLRSGGPSFEFTANGAQTLFVYVGDSNSTATVNVANGTGANFFVESASNGYSYLADPTHGTYRELAGFSAEAVSGSGGKTYAYVYSAPHASFVGDPGGSTFRSGNIGLTFSDFPQIYFVGTADGSDSATLHSDGGSFVESPGFSYVAGTTGSASFLIAALYTADVLAQAAGASDSAYFYSYAGNQFTGTVGDSKLTGDASGFAGYPTFAAEATGYQAVSVWESGTGTDSAALVSPGSSTFFATSTASTLTVGASTIVVNTYTVNAQHAIVAVAGKILVTGSGDGTDVATLYDASGTNVLTAGGNRATLSTPASEFEVDDFGNVTAVQQLGTSDTLDESAIDFTLTTVGRWTKV